MFEFPFAKLIGMTTRKAYLLSPQMAFYSLLVKPLCRQRRFDTRKMLETVTLIDYFNILLIENIHKLLANKLFFV